MTLHFHSPKSRRLVFIVFILISLAFSGTAFGKKKRSSGKSARATKSKVTKSKKATVSNRSRSRRKGRNEVARSSRRGRSGRLSARDARRPLNKRELRRLSARNRRAILAARRRAEAARRAAIARQIAIDKAMRQEVQAFIAKDDLTGEDPEVRRVAMNALGNHAGTVVVMDPITGRVYSMVNQEWALRRGFKPCSTIKLVTGVAGLSEDAIPLINAASDGYRTDLTSALARSDNPFFQQVGTKIGFDKMVNYARELGLGEKTGVNVPFEFPGRLPEMKPGFSERRMFSHADGFEVTPLQLGTLVSAMANGGKLLTPQIAHNPKELKKMNAKVRRQLGITTDVWQRMVPGMVGAVNWGSGRKAYDPTQTVAGKTGTCIGQGGWVGLFTSYAPLANPRLAVVVITQGTDARRHFPAAVAGEIYRQLNHRFGTAINLQVASTLDDEEKEVAEAEAAEKAAAEKAEANGETVESTNGETAPAVTATATPVITTPAPPAATKTAAPEPKNTVKRVLMPLGKKPEEAQKAPAAGASGEQRPRRIQP